jgi:hypothetical protein
MATTKRSNKPMYFHWRFGEGKLPRSEDYYWFVAIGIVVSWILLYLAIIIVLLALAHDKGNAPRSFYIIAMVGGLIGPLLFLRRLWVRSHRTDATETREGK